jgi:hypothetical protein
VPRYRPAPPPEPSDLVALPLHVLVRDWPELDPLLHAAGVELEAAGHLCLGEVMGSTSPSLHPSLDQPVGQPLQRSGAGEGAAEDGAPDPGVVMEQMAAATRWRSDPSS